MVEAGKDSARNTLLLFCGWDVKNKNKGFAAVPVLASKALVLRESLYNRMVCGVFICVHRSFHLENRHRGNRHRETFRREIHHRYANR